jgi:16S rRNA (uracil1498-N3)-methyltransferase
MACNRPKVRLFVDEALEAGATIGLSAERAHYLNHVMRERRGGAVALFNGRDGEWRATIDAVDRGWCSLTVAERLRLQARDADLWLAFAPVKRARIDFIAEKATELGVAVLQPVFTRFTAVERVNSARLVANATEAAEQCGRLTVPRVMESRPLGRLLAEWPSERRLMWADESGAGAPAERALGGAEPGPWAVLVGPEGGFAPEERTAMARLPAAVAVSLGPRTLRADTAVVAALSLWQHYLGDWRAAGPPAPGG